MTRILDNPFSVLAGPASSPTPQIASQRAAGARRSPFDGPGRTTLDGPVITVPLEKEGGFYYATVELNGRPFRFTLETGAGFFAISSRAANAIGVPIETMEVMSGTPAPVAAIDLVRLGRASFHNVTARVRSEWDSGGFDGIISIALLRDTLTTLDLGNRTLRLERGELPPPNDRDVLAMSGEDRGGRVDIPLIIGNQRVAAVLDTRADSWLVAPESLQPQLSLAAAPTFVANVRGPSVGAFELRGARLRGDVRIGPLTLEKPAVVFRRPPSVLVGVPLLEQFALTIDRKNRRVRITRADGRTSFEMPQQPWEGTTSGPRAAQPSASAQPGDPPTGAWTVGFMMRGAPGGTLTVARVFPDSDAATAGVMVGDQILELDGTPAASMTPAVARAVSARGTPFKVIMSRAGRRLEFTLSPHQVR